VETGGPPHAHAGKVSVENDFHSRQKNGEVRSPSNVYPVCSQVNEAAEEIVEGQIPGAQPEEEKDIKKCPANATRDTYFTTVVKRMCLAVVVMRGFAAPGCMGLI
jgi:hypothetical protein